MSKYDNDYLNRIWRKHPCAPLLLGAMVAPGAHFEALKDSKFRDQYDAAVVQAVEALIEKRRRERPDLGGQIGSDEKEEYD